MATGSDTSAAQILLKNVEFRHICLVEPAGRKVLHSVTAGEISCPAFVPKDRMRLFKSIVENGAPMFSGVLAGPDGKPIIILVSRFRDIIVIGGLRTAYFVELAQQITFGDRGHAVIVDWDGLVLAHPKQSWR